MVKMVNKYLDCGERGDETFATTPNSVEITPLLGVFFSFFFGKYDTMILIIKELLEV